MGTSGAKVAWLGLMLVLTAAISSSAQTQPATRPARDQPTTTRSVQRTVFAAPFENATGQDQYDPAAAGLSDLVGVLLAEQQNIQVVERQQLRLLTEEQAQSLKGLTGDKHAVQVGKLLHADTVLAGRLFLVQDKLTVSVKALDLGTSQVIAADQLSFQPRYLMEAALQMARELGKQMSLPLPEIDLGKIDRSPIASLHFAKALGDFYTGNLDAALMQLMRTIDLDPDYMDARHLAGVCYLRLGEDAHAIIEWEKFLERQPDSPLAPETRELLAAAKEREKHSTVPRFGPDSRPAGTPAPTTQGAGG